MDMIIFFFFFQAEDGIRDHCVTGVQTCALPICNAAALAYLDAIGARDELRGPKRCEIAFADMASGDRWTLRPNEGRVPWWLFLEKRRVPNTGPLDYLQVARLLRAPAQATIGEAMNCSGALFERL